MDYHISDLLDGLETAGQPIQPKKGNAARVKELTFSHLETAPVSIPAVHRRFRPARVIAAALAAILLLSSTVFAAWKLGIFRFEEEFGPAGKVLDSHAQSYDTNASTDVISADFGYAAKVKAQIGDYNLVLLELSASNGQLNAELDISPTHEGLPAYRDSGLQLRFTDHEAASSSVRNMGPYVDRVKLQASLNETLAPDEEIRFSLSSAEGDAALASFRLNSLEQNFEKLVSEEHKHYASSAQTQDFLFSLRTLTVSSTVIFAVIDVEARTDWGASHLDLVPEFAVWNSTHVSSGSILDARLVGSEEGLRRYLIGAVSNQPSNELGDSITFEILEMYEDGDMAGHAYYLFDVELKDLVPEEVELSSPTGDPKYSITWQTVGINATGMSIQGIGGELRYEPGRPTVELVFRDGTKEKVLDENTVPYCPTTDHEAIISDFHGWKDGSAHVSLSFAQPLDPSEIEAVLVDEQVFRFEP